jgi:hypothetical protein
MIRKPRLSVPPAPRSGFQQFIGAALVAAAAVALPAQADVIGFEGYAGPVGGTDTWTEGGYTVGFYANVAGGGAGNLVGQFFDNDESSCDASSLACPVGHDGTYYGALNDSYIDIWSDTIAAFSVKSFDASFIGGTPVLSSYPSTPAILRLQGIFANGSYLTQDFALTGAGAAGFRFAHFETTGLFATSQFAEVLAFGLVCNTSGSCSGFNSDRAQFGIDNINLLDPAAAAVPEPGTFALLGLGLMGLMGARRRRPS